MQNRASIILSFTIIMFYFAKPKSYSPLYLFLSFPFYAKIKRTQVTDRGKPPRFIYLKEGYQILLQKAWLSAGVKHLLYIRRKDRHIVAEIKFYIYRLTQICLCFFSGYQTFLDSVGPILSLFYVVHDGVDFVLVLYIHSIRYVKAIQVNLKMYL